MIASSFQQEQTVFFHRAVMRRAADRVLSSRVFFIIPITLYYNNRYHIKS